MINKWPNKVVPSQLLPQNLTILESIQMSNGFSIPKKQSYTIIKKQCLQEKHKFHTQKYNTKDTIFNTYYSIPFKQ
jgi:hypothetical protein